jgi:hypothetical protein
MEITYYDGCGREIRRHEEYVSIAQGAIFRAVTLCLRCGAPAAKLYKQVRERQRRPAEPERSIEA